MRILPLMETSEVKGHFLSTYWPSIASAGVLKPKLLRHPSLTETDLLEESHAASGLLSQEFFGVKEDTGLLLESSLSLISFSLHSHT